MSEEIKTNAEAIIKEFPEECVGLTPEKLRRQLRQFYDMSVKLVYESGEYKYAGFVDSKIEKAYETISQVVYEKNTDIPRKQVSDALKTMRDCVDGRGGSPARSQGGPLECGEMQLNWKDGYPKHKQIVRDSTEFYIEEPVISANPNINLNKTNENTKSHELLQEELHKKELNSSKLAKVRNKVAKFADKLAEATGTEKFVQKFTDGKKIADVEISTTMKNVEKKFSDKFFGKVKE